MEENNINIDNIYSKIIDKNYTNYEVNQIVLGTKKLIANNNSFKDYSKEYEEVTKLTTFKTPDEEYFPLLKNEEFISLTRIKYSYNSRRNKIKNRNLLSTIFTEKKITNLPLNNNISEIDKNDEKNFDKNNISNSNNNENNLILSSRSENKVQVPKKLLNNIKIIDNNIKTIMPDINSINLSKIKTESETNSSVTHTKRENFNINKDIIPNFISNSSNTFTNKFYKSKNIKNINFINKNKNNKSRNIFKIRNNFFPIFSHTNYNYNNRALLRDILLEEKNYSNLKYQPEKIFYSSEYYNNYIKQQIDLIRNKNIKLKLPEKFEKIYFHSKFGQPKLTLNSIIIEFKQKYSFDDKKFNSNEKKIFNIPFEYIPAFYYNNLGNLIEILISIFYLDETFTTFSSKYENFSHILNNSNIFKEKKVEIKQKKGFRKSLTSKIKIQNLQYLRVNTNKSLKRDSLKKDSIEDFKVINIYTTEYNLNNSNYYLYKLFNKSKENNKNIFINKNNDKIYYNSNNIFEYIWLTPAYQYLVTIKTPEIIFKINDIEIKKSIDIELLFFLAENNFKNWDFYIIEYLFSYYAFILIINNFFSKYKSNYIYNIKFLHDYKKNNINIINLAREKKLKYSKKNTKLEYIFTNDSLENHIKIFHNYKLYVYSKEINPFYQFCFHLNFIQMKSLYLASKKQGINYLLQKLLIFDKDNMKIKLKYEYLDNFCKNDLNNLELFLQNSMSIKSNKFNFNFNQNKYTLLYPIIETIKFCINNPKKNSNCFKSNLEEEEEKKGMNINILDSLINNDDVYNWPSIIEFNENKEKFEKQRKRVSIKIPEINFDLGNIPLSFSSSKKLNINYYNKYKFI